MTHSHRNHLQDETSPYLLQHAGNPVDWYPWCNEALMRAKAENRLMVISIGYAACHWCHVMERESFEDAAVAEIMNGFFLSVKIDREERPDIDQVYMNAAYVVTGRGGWPLNIIALPDGRPVYAGTYFRKDDWVFLLQELSGIWDRSPHELIQQAEEIQRKTERMDLLPEGTPPQGSGAESADRLFHRFERHLDRKHGGFEGAPKFPMPVNLDYLMQYAVRAENREALQALEFTLDRMADGGIADHLGGGFSRYSTDAEWHIPHFEKMLYDNAQLISTYANAYRLFGKESYAGTVRSVLAFTERELRSGEGLFYSSLDADSDGEEGAFYRWRADEVALLTGPDYPVIRDFYGITEEGNWEDGWNVLRRIVSGAELAAARMISPDDLQAALDRGNARLFEARSRRSRPATDTKILTAWNALMISACTDAAYALGSEEVLEKAVILSERLLSRVRYPDGKLCRTGRTGEEEGRISGFLDDYALLIRACSGLYQATFDARWLQEAEKMTTYVLSRFHDAQTGLFFYTSSDDPCLISRKKEVSDTVIPSSNAVMASELLTLGTILDRGSWVNLSERMLDRMLPAVERDPLFYAGWAILHLRRTYPDYLLCLVGENWREWHRKLNKDYVPHVLFAGGVDDGNLSVLKGKRVPGKTKGYACRNQQCSAPADNPEEIFTLITKNSVSLRHQ